ncbi:unnamed protein product [Tilletia controversa]|nr:unnamed protein product [Tilletia controversa]CAD6940011.1 unnamed protein product [Tilletia controversa]
MRRELTISLLYPPDQKAANKKTAAVTEWGKYGIINESDVISRLQGEFYDWLRHERNLNPETLIKGKERKEMSTFIEDYNTATLPSEKYYDLEKYERKMELIRQGETVPDDSTYDARADEAAAKASYKAAQLKASAAASSAAGGYTAPSATSHLSQQQLEDLARVSRERTQAAKMKALGIETSNNFGVRMDARLPGTR